MIGQQSENTDVPRTGAGPDEANDLSDALPSALPSVPGASPALDRTSGVSLWRQIADALRQQISTGALKGKARLPGELALARSFGVNRHTVRAAIAALQEEGLVQASPGRGTTIVQHGHVTMQVSPRPRFSADLGRQGHQSSKSVLSKKLLSADAPIASALALPRGAPCVQVLTLGFAEGRPVALAEHIFPEQRFADIADQIEATGSITAALAACGVADYLRQSTEIFARHAREDERTWLKLGAGAIVLEAHAINVDAEGSRIQFSRTAFPADRVSLSVDRDQF